MTKPIVIDMTKALIVGVAKQAAHEAIDKLTTTRNGALLTQEPFANLYIREAFLTEAGRADRNAGDLMDAIRREIKKYAKRRANGRTVSVTFQSPNLREGSLSFTAYLSPIDTIARV